MTVGGSKQGGEKSDVSARKTPSCLSNAVSSASGSSKHHAAAGSRHQAATKPAHVLVKRWPKKSVKSSVKGRAQPATSRPEPGDKLPVEIIFTWSTVDITWQVSVNGLIRLIVGLWNFMKLLYETVR